jgi:hypothetical protein
MTRKEILETAAQCVCGDREQDYGSPENNFQTIAAYWGRHLWAKHPKLQTVIAPNELVDAVDVAVMLAQLKLARIASGHAKEDNWVDLAGYAACGGEIQSKADRRQSPKPSAAPEYTSYGDTSYPAEALRHCEAQQRQRKTNTAEKKEYYPCVVWVYDDDTWDWDTLPTFCHADYGKNLVDIHTVCTVQVLEYSDGSKKSLGWWRSEQPPVKCCGDKDEVQDDDCN